MKRHLTIDVEQAARERIRILFDEFESIYVSFSGGKDSGVLLNLVIEEARKRDRLPVDVLIIDLEAQFEHTIAYILEMVNRPDINAFWVCLPLSLRNAVSQFQVKWFCWDPSAIDGWVRSKPRHPSVIDNPSSFPFFYFGMEFETFVAEFGKWYSAKRGVPSVCLVGIRADESINRYNAIKHPSKSKLHQHGWTTKECENFYKAYPIYDWHVTDIWIANGRFKWSYNRIYDLMHQAGLTLSQQRVCQPFGDDQRKGLWLYQILEASTWQKLVSRVAGANFGSRYSKNQSHILGHYRFDLPEGHTYRSYSKYLLESMPPHLAQHYRKRIFKFLNWWRKNGRKNGFTRIPDFAERKLEAKKKAPSWRRICKVLIKNDYWCKGLSFSQTKRLTTHYLELYESYLRREKL
ncbi:MAG: DUF3440 domain-containing protein [Pseudomonadales bacterium]|jgi:predicted phosphoadenosine phosphosulfate sulfurtransferase